MNLSPKFCQIKIREAKRVLPINIEWRKKILGSPKTEKAWERRSKTYKFPFHLEENDNNHYYLEQKDEAGS